MVVRFFMLQSHYRSTNDITDEALQAAEKGYQRLMEAFKILDNLGPAPGRVDSELDKEIKSLIEQAHADMDDDFNVPKALSRLFEIVPKINSLGNGQIPMDAVSADGLEQCRAFFRTFIIDIFGLKAEETGDGGMSLAEGLMDLILDIRQQSRTNKDWATSDKIRDHLAAMQIVVKDGKEGSSWTVGG
jgi:cysteinyl-tRNA synthetase